MASKPLKTQGGYYYITWTRNGKQTAESLKTKSLEKARKKKAELENLYYEGKHDPWTQKWYEKPDTTLNPYVGEAVEKYVHYKANLKGKKGWSANTTKMTASRLRMFARMTYKPLHQLSERDLHNFFYRSDISDHTRKSDRTKVLAFLTWCRDQGYITHKIDSPVDEPQEEIPEFLTTMQLKRICAVKRSMVRKQLKQGHIKGDNNQYWMIDAWMLAARTGMRKSELMNVKVSDCHGGFILIGGSTRTKSNKQRKVPVMDLAEKIVSYYCSPDVRKSNTYLSNSPYLFGRHGNSTADKLSRKFAQCRELVMPGQSNYTFHSLRHTFAVWYLTQEGGNFDFRLYRLQRILGHADLSTTMIYLKAIPYDLKL